MERPLPFLISFAAIAVSGLASGPPTIVSLTPDSGTGPSVTFQAVYSDPNGAADLSELLLQMNTTQSSVNGCYVYYQPQGNHLYLATDAGNVWITPALTPGVAGTASNSRCTLNAGSSSVVTAGNDLTLTVALSFSSMEVGARNVYLYAAGLSGQNSGWVKEGTWTTNLSFGPPTIVSLSPNSGDGPSVTFQAIYSDPNGTSDLSELLLLVNTSVNGATACYMYYQPQGNHLYLSNDAGTAWLTPALTPGVAGTASNSQCTLNAGTSSVSTAGNDLTVNADLTFKSAFVGARNVYLYAAGSSGQNSGWVKEGTWTPVASAGAPSISSLTPDMGTGDLVTFDAIYTDPNGAADLNEVLLQVNTTQSSANACYVYYQPQGNHLYLADNAGNVWMTPALTPGVAGTASNSQCTLNAGMSSAFMTGNILSLTVALTFTGSVVGAQNVYLYAAGLSGQNSGWVREGVWTPNSVGPPSIVSLMPNTGGGSYVTFKAAYADPNGANDLGSVLLQVNSVQSSIKACYVYYQPLFNRLYLADDSGAFSMPALTPGVAGTSSNGQCTLFAGSSSVVASGNNLTLSVALGFNSLFIGAKSVYLNAAGLGLGGQTTGWLKVGTWTVTNAGPPAIVSLLPNSGNGSSVTFQATYSDPNGVGDLSQVQLIVGNNNPDCNVSYQPRANLLYLANDAGTPISPGLTPGVAGTVSNSQCTLNAGSSSVAVAGNNLTLNVALNFSVTFDGLKNVYLYASGFTSNQVVGGLEGGWNPSNGAPAIVSLTPNTGAGNGVTFQAVYSDPNGAAALNEILLQVNYTQSSANACYVYYNPQANLLYLANNAGTAWMTPGLTPGVAGTASNFACMLFSGLSSVTGTGNDLTLNVSLQFSPAFLGNFNVYLYGAGFGGQNTGWINKGTWRVP
jgi:hypothetical protein